MTSETILSKKPKPIGTYTCKHCEEIFEFVINAKFVETSCASVQCFKCHKKTTVDLASLDPLRVKLARKIMLNGDDDGTYNQSHNATNQSPKNNAHSSSSHSKKPIFEDIRLGSGDHPKNTLYYDILGVSPTASQEEIKKRYRILALRYHPDKAQVNQEENSEDKFREISTAYQILSDPDSRKRYNEYGIDTHLENNFPNPEDFFKQLFGGDKFTELIGELSLGKDFKEAYTMEKKEGEANPVDFAAQREEQKNRQEERINTLTSNLIQKMEKFTLVADGHNDESELQRFREGISKEAELLKEESYGVQLLHTIGYVYLSKYRQFMAKKEFFGVGRFWQSCQEKGHILSETFSMIKSAIDLQNSFQQLQKANDKSLSPEELAELEAKSTAKGLNTMWKGSKLEIESVLREVCDRVLLCEDQKMVLKRAVALRVMGEVYSQVIDDISENDSS